MISVSGLAIVIADPGQLGWGGADFAGSMTDFHRKVVKGAPSALGPRRMVAITPAPCWPSISARPITV
jgi:hypothetical protein